MSDLRFISELGDELTETGMAYYDREKAAFLYVNKSFLEIFEIGRNQLLQNAESLLTRIRTEDVELLRHQYRLQMQSGHFKSVELEINFGNRKSFVGCDTILLGKGRGFLLFVKDVTRRRSHVDYVIKLSAEKDTLLDMLTHNLSGPLLVSKDILNTLRSGVDQNNISYLSKMINLVQENTEQCIDIVNDYLRKEHVESIRVVVSPSLFDVIEKTNIILDKLRELNPAKTFVLSSTESKMPVFADAVKYFQVIHNLLSNSVKYTAADGIIEVNITQTRETVMITVKDNGVGVDENLRNLLFSERVKGREGLNGEKSFGLGLSIAKKLVDLMGGIIWLDVLTSHKGAVFHLELP